MRSTGWQGIGSLVRVVYLADKIPSPVGYRVCGVLLTDENIAHAQDLLAKMDDRALPVAEFLQTDADFHVLLASSSSNPLISALMGALRNSI